MIHYVILACVLSVLALVLIKFARNLRQRTYAPTALNRFGLFVGAISLIWAAEYMVPSTRMTGLEPSQNVKPERYLDNLSMPDHPLTYGDVAASAPWLWSLGRLTRDDMEQRLAADIVLAQTSLDAAVKARETVSTQWRVGAYERENQFFRLQILVDGLHRAQTDLDALFGSDPVTGTTADVFVYGHLDAAKTALDQKYRAEAANFLEQRQALTVSGATEEQIADDPRYQELQEKERKSRSTFVSITLATSQFEQLLWRLEYDKTSITPDTEFPVFTAPLPMFEGARPKTPQRDETARLGPDGTSPGILVQVQDAVTGRRRHTGSGFSETRCGIRFGGGEAASNLEFLCEIATQLKLNYDLVMQACDLAGQRVSPVSALTEQGTQVTDDLCKESWVYPHLNVIFAKDRFTVYPPRPTPAKGQISRLAPFSQWSVSWNGETRDLVEPVTFPWDGADRRLPGLTLTHGVRGDADQVQIWADFRAGGLMDAASIFAEADAAVGYEPEIYEGFEHRFATAQWPVTFGAPASEENSEKSELRLQLVTRRTIAESLTHRDDVSKGIIAHCRTRSRPLPTDYSDTSIRTSVRRVAGLTNAHPCEAYGAYARLLDRASRSLSAGSWVWMLSK